MAVTWKKLAYLDAVVTHSLATAANDFLVASGVGVFVKKTLAETKTILGYTDAASIDPGHKHSELWSSDGSWKSIDIDSYGYIGINTAPGTYALHLYDTAANVLFVERYSATSVPNLMCLYHNQSGSPAAGQGPAFTYYGKNASGTMTAWALIAGLGEDITAGAEHGCVAIFSVKAGVFAERVRINSNIGLGVTAFGTSAGKVLGIGSGTAPTTAPADMAQMWVQDINAAAGYAGLHKRTETTNQVEIVPGVIIKTDTGSPANPYEGLMEINTFDNKVRMYADAGWRELGTW